jgi:hypothetical protein
MAWITLGESVTGTSHGTGNIACQDAFRFRAFGSAGEWLVIAAADGAGSASHAEAGSKLACDEFVHRVGTVEPDGLFTREGMTALFTEVRTALLVEAESLKVRPRELACTALLAVIGPASAVFGQIGDGVIVRGHAQDYQVVFWPEPAEYANATDFLTDDSFGDLIRFEIVYEPIEEVAALTDGLQRLALNFSARTAHLAFFQPLFNTLRTATNPEFLVEPFRSFLDSREVNGRTDDDKTLVRAIRQP